MKGGTIVFGYAPLRKQRIGNEFRRRITTMKTNTYTTQLTAIIGLALILGSWTIAFAQQDQKFAIAARQNAQALHHYTWKSQTQIRKEGEVKATKLYSSRYAADGTVVQLLIEEHSTKLPKFGIRGIVARKKKDEAQEMI